MLNKINDHIKELQKSFSDEDEILLNNKEFKVSLNNFFELGSNESLNPKKVCFIDGGQAVLINASNFVLSFIRVAQVTYGLSGVEVSKVSNEVVEFYLLSVPKMIDGKLFYVSKIFCEGDSSCLFESKLLTISPQDKLIRDGNNNASLVKVTNIARRFCELRMAALMQEKSDIVVMDGSLDCKYPNEEEFLSALNGKVCSVSKSSTVFTRSGNSSAHLLGKLSPFSRWGYKLDDLNYFVKLNKLSKHVFRFQGNSSFLLDLMRLSNDAIFVGYPYGLIEVDRLARVTNRERENKRLYLFSKNKDLELSLSSSNAHDILDNVW
jgi:hypothetical protein